MKVTAVKTGDNVQLFNGTIGVISKVNGANYQFAISEPFEQWFHVKDIKFLNGTDVEFESLVIE